MPRTRELDPIDRTEVAVGSGSGGGPLPTSREVLAELFGPPDGRGFAVRYWNGRQEPVGSRAPFTLVLTWPGALRRMLLPPTERSLGEAFVRGDCRVEGDLEAAVRTVEPVLRGLRRPAVLLRLLPKLRRLPRRRDEASAGEAPARTRARPSRSGTRHSDRRDARSVRHHYDVDADFFRLWLDPWMQYSCGYFPDGQESLAEGQEKKLRQIGRRLELEPGERLLDVGCGWGGLIHYLAERFGVEALGITLSEPQARAARRRLEDAGLADRCEVRVLDYRHLPDDLQVDKAVSVGMVEHVGHRKLPEYFARIHRHLRPGGLFLNQGIVTLEETKPWLRRLRERLLKPATSFIEEYVFPDGELVSAAERIGPAERAGFELRAAEGMREHYAATLRRWVRRLEEHGEEAVEQVGRTTCRVWRLYMSGSAHAFASGQLGLLQALYRKPETGW